MLALRPAAVLLCVVLTGCSGPRSYYPVDWWRQLEGGRIAESRPPPPNEDAPYPHLGSVPARPSGTDAAGRARIAGGLVTDRSNAQYASQLAPLAALPPTIRAARPVQPTPSADDSTASLTAASAPPAVPVAKVQAAEPAPVAPAAPAPVQARSAEPISQLPDMAASPPPPPMLPGVARFTAQSAPPPRPPTPPALVAPAAPGQPLSIPFAAGWAVLPEGANQALTALARRPGVTRIVVVGYGDAADADPDIQTAALPLALARAQAIRTSLRRIGVAETSIQMTAEAVGRGGVARAE